MTGGFPHLIFDFDSTLVTIEALDELAARALKGHPNRDGILDEIRRITALCMEGEISFHESLSRRLAIFRAHKSDVEAIAELARNSPSASVARNKDFFQKYRGRIHVISGGFDEMIFPFARDFGIPAEHIRANAFAYDDNEWIVGIEENRLTAKDHGKALALKSLRLKGEIIAIGDGWTDYEMKTLGGAAHFFAFAENTMRDAVVSHADRVFENFDSLRKFLDGGDS